MSELSIQQDGGRLSLSGVLDFSSVPQAWARLQQMIGQRAIEQQSDLQLSLAGVTAANSAALALLLEARELAVARGVRLSFTDLPTGLLDLAALSNATKLLGIER